MVKKSKDEKLVTFKKVTDQEINILMKGKVVGNIFTPSGSGHNCKNAIQICGFDDAFDLWGCAVFCDAKRVMKKDVQLLFSETSIPEENCSKFDMSNCFRCFNRPCTCDDIRIKSSMDLHDKMIFTQDLDGAIKNEYDGECRRQTLEFDVDITKSIETIQSFVTAKLIELECKYAIQSYVISMGGKLRVEVIKK